MSIEMFINYLIQMELTYLKKKNSVFIFVENETSSRVTVKIIATVQYDVKLIRLEGLMS